MADGETLERVETVTVLFTDLVGSTELRHQLGEEGSDRLRRDHDGLVAGAIEAAGGTVVKSTGDGVMATFPGAADAVGAAIAVQQAIHEHNRRDLHTRLAVRIGISSGDVTIEADGDCFGLPVVEAQRLESAAQPGQILCSALVRALTRGRGDHRFEPVGEFTLKGLPEPLSADEVRWEPLAAPTGDGGPALPPLLQPGTVFAFAGRERELATLIDAWKTCSDGAGQLVLLAGEPGIGKTRLVAELAARVLDAGGLVLAGRSDEDLTTPYGPVLAALSWWAERAPHPLELGDWPADLLRLAPELASMAPTGVEPTPGDTDAGLVVRALRSWLEHLTAAAPTLLVLDDLHWADAASLVALRSLFDRAPVGGLLVVGTYRDTDLDRRHPLAATLADLRRHEHVTRLPVNGLSQDGVGEFLAAAAGYPLDTPGLTLATAVWEETAGNPFFVGEILRHLAETGAIVEQDGAWTAGSDASDFGIPEGIREVVGRRLSRLGDETERVLSMAAVIGLEVDVEVLADALGTDVDAVLDALEEAGRAALVDEVGAERWRFAHAIVRETLLDELSSSRRVRQHRKVAAAIEARASGDLDAVANQLAYHWGEAAAGGTDLEPALRWGMRAGDLAADKSAIEDAIRWYEHTLGLLDPDVPAPAAECAVLVRLARAQAVLGGRDHRPAMLRAAHLAFELDDHEALTAALVITSHSGYSVNPEEASPELLALLEQALTVVGPDEPARRAQLLGALALELQWLGEGDRRAAVCDEAIALATASQDTTALFAAGVAYFYSYPIRLSSAERWIELSDTQRAIWPDILATGDSYRIAIELHFLWYSALWSGDCALMEEVDELSRDLMVRRPNRLLQMTTTNREVLGALVRGDLDEAAARLTELRTLDETNGVEVLQFGLTLERGDAGLAVPVLEQALTLPVRCFVEAMLATALVETGDHDRANALVDLAMDEGPDRMPDDTLAAVTLGMFVEAGVRLGRRDRVDDLARWAATVEHGSKLVTGVMYFGAADRIYGGIARLRGDLDAAEVLLRSAIEDEARVGAVPALVAARLEFAEVELARGDLERSSEIARVALSEIGDLPLGRRRRQAEELLARSVSA